MAEPIQKTIVDEDGDILLAIGEPVAYHITVSSKILSVASQPFRRMFSGNFSEAQALQKSNSDDLAVIRFPDADFVPMLLLCQLLHFNPVPKTPELHVLLGIAKLCDMYDCAGALQHASTVWLDEYEPLVGTSGYDSLLAISYLLGNAEKFRSFSLAIVQKFSGRYGQLVVQDSVPSLPDCVHGQLKALRSQAYNHVNYDLQMVFELFATALKATPNQHADDPPCIRSRVADFAMGLVQIGVWPMNRQNLPMAKVYAKLANFQEPERHKFCRTGRSGARECQGCQILVGQILRCIPDRSSKVLRGLCLACVKARGICRAHAPSESLKRSLKRSRGSK